ncbi:PhzF family isomerase [Aestuariivivens insulae]|uniref:PhzF family isomerase n=1 Tax=Aestuariivivens insulae TaxID=1621988 RepID=UPI001F59DCEE|nr:PhzF family isomerase [Aestuariivivens insulae]
MKNRIVYQIDSFTREKFKGNPAGVVLHANGLSDLQMQQIARELNNSETAFLFSADQQGIDGEIRYFTPTTEVPSCGHATIATGYALAMEKKMGSCVLKMKTQIGVLPIEIHEKENDYSISMTQGAFSLSPEFDEKTTNAIVSSLGLSETDRLNNCPIQIASTGHSKVMIGIKSRKKLNALSPKMDALKTISSQIGCNGYFVFTFDSNDKDILTYGRMFAPAIGIDEDPVTGNANGPLGGYLIQNEIIKPHNNLFEFTGRQGEQMGRLGEINVQVSIENQVPSTIKINGEAVVIFRTELFL